MASLTKAEFSPQTIGIRNEIYIYKISQGKHLFSNMGEDGQRGCLLKSRPAEFLSTYRSMYFLRRRVSYKFIVVQLKEPLTSSRVIQIQKRKVNNRHGALSSLNL